MEWYEKQQGQRALEALPKIASELKKIREILQDAFKEDDPPPPTAKCTCPHPSEDPPGAEHGRTRDLYCPVHGDTKHGCTCTDKGDYPPYNPDCPVHEGNVEGACTCLGDGEFDPTMDKADRDCPVHGDKA